MVKRGLSRDGLVRTAHEYVAAHGLDALTMRRLAAAAGVTPGALYRHFRDRDDLQRSMADAIFAAVDLADIDTDSATVDDLVTCCERMRSAMLAFRDGGRIIAGAYSPFPSALRLSTVLRALVASVSRPEFDAGDLVFVLRSYAVGFVIEEQAFLSLHDFGDWGSLVAVATAEGAERLDDGSDVVAIMTGDRDKRFAAGLAAILAGTVR